MSRKEPNPLPEGLTKPAPPPAPPRAELELEDVTLLDIMRVLVVDCEDIMKSPRSTIEAKSAALDLQLAALRMKVLIMEEGFFKKEKY
jgi:hypothetical protein